MANICPHPLLQAGVVWVNWQWWTCHSNFIDRFMTFYMSQLLVYDGLTVCSCSTTLNMHKPNTVAHHREQNALSKSPKHLTRGTWTRLEL